MSCATTIIGHRVAGGILARQIIVGAQDIFYLLLHHSLLGHVPSADRLRELVERRVHGRLLAARKTVEQRALYEQEHGKDQGGSALQEARHSRPPCRFAIESPDSCG